MKRQIIIIIGSLLLFLTALSIFPVNVIDIRQLEGLPFPRAIPSNGKPLGLKYLPNATLGQTFRPTSTNISGFGVYFNKPFSAETQSNVILLLKAKEKDKIETLFKTVRKAGDIELNTINTFYFKPFKVKEGQMMSIVIEGAVQNGITPYRSFYNPYKRGSAFLNDKPSKYDIVFQTYYQANLFGFFSKKTRIDIVFFFLWVVAIIVGLSIIAIFAKLHDVQAK